LSDSETGAVAVVVAAVALLSAILGVVIGDVGRYLAATAQAATAADAAALAAAPVTFRPYGASGTPRAEAARFAVANGATLVRCGCAVDSSFADRDVVVEVVAEVDLVIVGTIGVRATSRARFSPSRLGLPVDSGLMVDYSAWSRRTRESG
jgi:Flp pilus assembly protein TadG